MNKIFYLIDIIQKLKIKKENLNDEIKKLVNENKNIPKENVELNDKIKKLEKMILKLKEYEKHLTKTKIKGIIVSISPIIIGLLFTLFVKIGKFKFMNIDFVNINNLDYLATNAIIIITLVPFLSVLSFKDYYDYKKFIKHNNIKKLEKDLRKIKEKIKTNNKKYEYNNQTITDLKKEERRLDLKIQTSILELSKYEMVKNMVLMSALNNQQIFDDITEKISQNQKQKTK